MRYSIKAWTAQVFAAAILAYALAFAGLAQATDGGFSKLTIETASGPRVFQVEVAADDAVRAQGLMFRRELAPDHGMLFEFGKEEPVSMWMKNTYVPLDMVFIRADGTIHRIEERTTPLSTRTIDSGVPVRYVLEIPAGTAERLGIKRGDRVHHAIINGGS